MSFNEKLSYTEHVVTTPATDFSIGFKDYGENSDTIKVTVNDVLATDAGYTVSRKNAMTISLEPAVTSGVVRLQRETNIDSSFYRFTAGAKFVAANIDANFNQILHSQQETRDGFDKLAGDVYPLVDGLEVALSKADEASKAAQEAADAAEEAAQATRSTSQVIDESGLNQQAWNNGVESLADLTNIPTPKNGNRVFVKAVEKWYTYTPTTTETNNGATVVGKWVMDIQDAYYASDFLPDSSIDNAAEPQDVAINKLYQYATSKGRAFIIDKPYYVRSVIKGGGESYPALNPFNSGGVSHAIRIQSNSVLAFMGEGALKLVPSALDFTAILLVHDVENYVILDPKCYGDRDSHLTTTGEQGICYHFGASKNGYVRNPHAYNAWGDGFYFGFTFYVKPFLDVIVPTNLVIDNPHGYNLSRNGISLCGADNLTINSPYMEKVDRVSPKAGIDIEPEEDINFTNKMFIRNVKIHNATFVSCGYGYTHNVFGNRQVEVSFTGTTKILNKGSITSWIPMLLQSRLNSGQAVSDYQQQGYIDFDKVIVDDIGSSLAFRYLMIVATPEKSIPVTINSYEFISTNYEPEIALDQANEYTKSSGLTVKEFVFRKQINQVKLVFEAAVTKAIPSINYHLGIPDSIQVIYRGKGITFHGKCFIGGYDLISGVFLNENQLINNVFIQPAANADDGGAIYGRVTIRNNERKVRYSLTPGLTAPQIGYGLQVNAVGFFKTSTTPNASIELKQMAYPSGVQVYSSYGSWVNP